MSSLVYHVFYHIYIMHPHKVLGSCEDLPNHLSGCLHNNHIWNNESTQPQRNVMGQIKVLQSHLAMGQIMDFLCHCQESDPGCYLYKCRAQILVFHTISMAQTLVLHIKHRIIYSRGSDRKLNRWSARERTVRQEHHNQALDQ